MRRILVIECLLAATLLLSPSFLNALPEGEFEVGDAVYNDLIVSGFYAYYDHAGLFVGVAPDPSTNEPYGIVLEALKDSGVTENTLSTFYMQYGPYTPPPTNFPYEDRIDAVQLALECLGIDYVSEDDDPHSYNALNYYEENGWEGTVYDIESIRCDGLVEYALEAVGVRVWEKNGYWNISAPSDYYGDHPWLDIHNDLPPLGDPLNQCYFYPKTQRSWGYCPEEACWSSMELRAYVDLPVINSVEHEITDLFDFLRVSTMDVTSGIAYLRYAVVEEGQTPGQYDWRCTGLAELGDYQQTRDISINAYNPGDYYFTAVDGGGNISEPWIIYGFEPSQDNPAASVHGFSVAGGLACWKVSSEYKTDHYRIDCAESSDGPWTTLCSDLPGGSGYREETVGTEADWYRLVEVETSGHEIIHGIARPRTRTFHTTEPKPSTAFLRKRVEELNRLCREGLAGEPPRWGLGDSVTVFTPNALLNSAQYALAHYWTCCGYAVELVDIDDYPTDPDSFRTTLKNEIALRANAGVKYFLLLGDANDWQWFDLQEQGAELWTGPWAEIHQSYLNSGYPEHGQRVKDIIPTFMIPDTLPRDMNLAWFTPYVLSDQSYQDTDGDGIPDVVLTRLPFTNENDVWAYGAKMQLSQMPGEFGADTASFFVGDVDHVVGHSTGQMARDAADSVLAALPGSVDTHFLYESDIPYAGDRNDAAALNWNQWNPEILIMFASLSNRSWPANFFDQTDYINPWTMDMIHACGTHAALVFAGSCDGSDFARTEDPDYGLPIAHRFLAEWDKGAISWIGPSLGSWQRGNHELGVALIEELYADPERPAAESYLLALQRVLSEHPDRPDIIETVKSYHFLGDPLSRVAQMDFLTATPDGAPEPHVLRINQNTPNPFNPETRITFELDRKGRVTLAVFDVGGRRVCMLQDGVMEAGAHTITWKGRSQTGEAVASGVYFIQLKSGERTLSRKMMLLK